MGQSFRIREPGVPVSLQASPSYHADDGPELAVVRINMGAEACTLHTCGVLYMRTCRPAQHCCNDSKRRATTSRWASPYPSLSA
jgi:hypothetical protein